MKHFELIRNDCQSRVKRALLFSDIATERMSDGKRKDKVDNTQTEKLTVKREKGKERKKLKYRQPIVSPRKGQAPSKDDKLDLGCSYFDIQCLNTKEIVTETERKTG